MDEVTVSVVTPTYNQAKYLPDCIESVSKSVFAPLDVRFEHIVFDDGSTDETQRACSKYPFVKYLRWEKNKGQSAAMNEAIRQAKGEFIFTIDSDDVVMQRTLYHFYSALRDSKNRWVYSDFLRVDRDLSYRIGDDYYGWNFTNTEDMLASMFAGKHFIQHNVMYYKDLHFEVGGYDEEIGMAEDLDLFVRFLLKGEMPLYIPTVSHLHRYHETNLSIGQGGEKHMKNLEILKKKYNWEK